MPRDLTKGSVGKNIIFFSLPFFLSYFLQTLYGLADLFIIGRYNTIDCTTAVSNGSQLMHMVTVIIVGITMGTTVMIGHSVGSKDTQRMKLAIGNTITLLLSFSVLLAFLLLIFKNQIIQLLSVPKEAVAETKNYLTVCFLGIPLITAYNIISSIFRGMGDSKSPMYFIAIACLFNIGLDYLFVGTLQLGATGAALGTILAQCMSVIFSIFYTIKKKLIPHLSKSDLKLRIEIISDLLKVGFPIAVQDGLIQVSFIVIAIFANQRGLTDATAVGIVEKIIGIVFLVPSSMLSSVSTLSSQNIGAKQPQRAKDTLKYGICICVIYGIIVSILFQFVSECLVSLFVTDTENIDEVVRMGTQYLHSYVWDCIFAGMHFCFSGYFCACQKSNLSFIHNVISIFLIRIPISYYAAHHFADTLFPMGMAAPLGSIISVFICLFAYYYILGNAKKCKEEIS